MKCDWIIACRSVEQTPTGGLSLIGVLKAVRIEPADLAREREIVVAFRFSGTPGEIATLNWSLTGPGNDPLVADTVPIALQADNDFAIGSLMIPVSLKSFGRHTVVASFGGEGQDSSPTTTWFDVREQTAVHPV